VFYARLLAHAIVPWLKQTIGHLAESDELPGRGVSDVDCTEKQLFRTLLDVCISYNGARCGAGITDVQACRCPTCPWAAWHERPGSSRAGQIRNGR